MGAVASCISNLLYLGEKITLCATCAGLIWCLVLTITMTLAMGIGLGYNYCFVDMKTRYKYVKGHYIYPGSPRWPHSRLGSENALKESEFEDDAEVNLLRRSQYKIEGVPPSISPEDVDPELLRELGFNDTLTDDEGIVHYRPTLPNSESINGTEITTLNSLVDDDDITNLISETSFTNSSSTTASNNSSNKKVKKLVIPITGLDLISLLSRLSAENKNYSLQVVTT